MKKWIKNLKTKMSSKATINLTPEIETRALNNLGLPLDVLKKGVVNITHHLSDHNGTLFSLHYNQIKLKNVLAGKYPYNNTKIEAIKSCRGAIIDGETGEKVLTAFPWTNLILTDSIPENGILPIRIGNDLKYPKECRYTKCYGGALLRFFSRNGVVKGSTNKRIDASDSHFAESDNFIDIFLTRQDVFETLESLYETCDEDIIHLFILNDRELLVDSRELQNEDRIVYLKSFSIKNPNKKFDLTNFILSKNETSKKPIEICKELSVNEVNRRLSGNKNISQLSNQDFNSSTEKPSLIFFSGGEKVIYENEFGIFTLIPNSCNFRQTIMDGKVNIRKLFVDSVGSKSTDLLEVAFPYESLLEIAGKIQSKSPYDLSLYNIVSGQHLLTVLTNLIFIVPEHRIFECFDIYNSFGSELLKAIHYFNSIKNDVADAVSQRRLESYNGMSSMGVKFKQYVSSKIISCLDDVVDEDFKWSDSQWPTEVTDYFSTQYRDYCDELNDKKLESLSSMKITLMILNAPDDTLYSFLNYETKVKKERIALEKRLNKTIT
uniref:Uncharacterized protein n=1 Tax=viral metagenome TaxID=1070528 RepID=A0A6C0BEI7_9ZZZZ